jgi:glucosylceramidase
MLKTDVRWISSSPRSQWKQEKVRASRTKESHLRFNRKRFQTIDGFGGCFNELGWIALSRIRSNQRQEVLDEFFDKVTGCRFNYCRTPIGASDFAAEWYSYNETDGDFRMESFSIERDFNYLIPYIKEALQRNPGLTLFASPWSPPTWMKSPRIYNGGSLRWEEQVLRAYALYFLNYIDAYKKAGIRIDQLHFQNEPWIQQVFASCLWSGEQMRDFLRDYIGPLFEKSGCSTELWLGTINCGDYKKYAHIVLNDPGARKYVRGISYQWDGKYALQQTQAAWPDIKMIQSENECGDGNNTWEYAGYVFYLLWHYLTNGVSAYIYWNLVLQTGGLSTWMGRQNAMVTVDPESGQVSFNPDFYVMKHFSHFIDPGAVRIGLEGSWSAHALAFENPSGSHVLVVSNPLPAAQTLQCDSRPGIFSMTLEPFSINTVVLG